MSVCLCVCYNLCVLFYGQHEWIDFIIIHYTPWLLCQQSYLVLASTCKSVWCALSSGNLRWPGQESELQRNKSWLCVIPLIQQFPSYLALEINTVTASKALTCAVPIFLWRQRSNGFDVRSKDAILVFGLLKNKDHQFMCRLLCFVWGNLSMLQRKRKTCSLEMPLRYSVCCCCSCCNAGKTSR